MCEALPPGVWKWCRDSLRGVPTGRDAVIDLDSCEVVFRADFDLLDDAGCLEVSSRFARGRTPPEPGEKVYLIDGSGQGCVAVVEDVTGHYGRVRPEWES